MRAVLVVVALAGCVESGEVRCADGRLCPPGYTCDDAHMRCLSADQVAACSGRDEGASCTIAGAPGACRSGACEPLVCGDGVKAVGESCDGTDLGAATCKDAGFYDEPGLVCTSFCTFDVSACTGFCGDGMVNGPELCDGTAPPEACSDFGYDAGSVTCGNSCGISFDTCARFGWVPEATDLDSALAMDASSVSDVWVGGSKSGIAAVAHFAGNTWTLLPLVGTGAPSAIAAISDKEAWIVRTTTPRTIEHYLNGAWMKVTDVPSATYRDIWAAGTAGVFVATTDAGILEWTGSAWQTVGTLGVSAQRVTGTRTDDVWVVTTAGDLQHWDGAAWSPITLDMTVRKLSVIDSSDIWAIGASISSPNEAAIGHWDGTQWTITLEPSLDPTIGKNFSGVTGSAPNDVWVTEPLGHARHFDGINWSEVGSVGVNPGFAGFPFMKSFAGTTIGITSDGYFYRYRGYMYARLNTGSASDTKSSASTSPSQTVVIDNASAWAFDGTTWTPQTVDTQSTPRTNLAVWAAAPDDIWCGGGNGLLFRYDGGGWVDTAWGGNMSVWAIYGFSSTDVWIFGTSVYHYDGLAYTLSTLTPADKITRASGSATNDVWAISFAAPGSDVHHWNGSTWTTTHLDDPLADIVGLGPDNAYAVGTNRIYHWDGATWTSTMYPVTSDFVSISATGPSDIFAAAPHAMFHYDGQRWASVRVPVDVEITTNEISHVDAHRGYIDLTYNYASGYTTFRRLIRTRLWSCAASETNCSDGVDDDCDNAVDHLDTDCP